MNRVLLAALATSLVSACGGSSPTQPSGPTYPQVNGNYSGTTTMVFPELSETVRCPTSTTVTQTNANVSIAPLVLAGECSGMSIPFGPFGPAIMATNGALGNQTGTFDDPDCGRYSYTSSGSFSGRELRMSVNAVSSTCWDVNVTVVLTR